MVQERKEYDRAYYQAHKEEIKAKRKAYYEDHKAEKKAYREAHKDEYHDYQRNYQKAYSEADVNSSGQPKRNIRRKSQYYLDKHGTKIQGYEIHHCFTYDEPYKFIYCSKELHKQIHVYLREHNIDADSDHYQQIKHLFNETVVLYGI